MTKIEKVKNSRGEFIKHGFGEGDRIIADNQYFKITVIDSETSFTFEHVNWLENIWLRLKYFLIKKYGEAIRWLK